MGNGNDVGQAGGTHRWHVWALAALSMLACQRDRPGAVEGSSEALKRATEALASGAGDVTAVQEQLAWAVDVVERDPGRLESVRLAGEAGRAARLLAERGDDVPQIAQTRAALSRVVQQVGLPGLCDTGLALAELDRAMRPDARRDLAALTGLHERFGSLTGAARCLERAAALHARWLGQASPARAGQGPDTPAAAGEWLAARARARAGPATLLGVEVFGQDEQATGETRIVLSFDRAATYRRTERAAEGALPRRVLIDLDGVDVAPQLPPHIPLKRGGVDRLRIVPFGDGNTRLSFDLRPEAEYRMYFLPDPYRMVFDFRAAHRALQVGGLRRLVIDPGHGGRNPGAKGPTGLRESDVALSIARRVRNALRRKLPGVEVLLTRDSDCEVSLEERAAIANGVDADLFVSLHLNASGSPEDRGGVSTFVLDTSNDEQALRLAARENGTATEEITALQVVLAGLHRSDQVQQSRRAAEAIHRAALAEGRRVLPQLPDRGVKSAMFYVLVGAMMPAVLVEASFITRPEEEAALRTDRYRTALSEGIARGIEAYAAQLARR